MAKISLMLRDMTKPRRATGPKTAGAKCELPDDIIFKIMGHMDADTFSASRLVSKRWNDISLSGSLFRRQLDALVPLWQVLHDTENIGNELSRHRHLNTAIQKGPSATIHHRFFETSSSAAYKYSFDCWYDEELNSLWNPLAGQPYFQGTFDPESDFDKSIFCEMWMDPHRHAAFQYRYAAYHPGTSRIVITNPVIDNLQGKFLFSANKEKMAPHHHIDIPENHSVSQLRFSNDAKWFALDISGSLSIWHIEDEPTLKYTMTSKRTLDADFSCHSKMLAVSHALEDGRVSSQVVHLDDGLTRFLVTHRFNPHTGHHPKPGHSFSCDDSWIAFSDPSGHEVLAGRIHETETATSTLVRWSIGADRVSTLAFWFSQTILFVGTEHGRIVTYSLRENGQTRLWSFSLPLGPIDSFFWNVGQQSYQVQVDSDLYALSFSHPQSVAPDSSTSRNIKRLLRPFRPKISKGAASS